MDPSKIVKSKIDPKQFVINHIKQMNPNMPDEIAEMLFGDSSDKSSSDSDSSNSHNEEMNDDEDVKEYKGRRTYTKRNQYESNWYVRYLESDETREILREDPTHRDTK